MMSDRLSRHGYGHLAAGLALAAGLQFLPGTPHASVRLPENLRGNIRITAVDSESGDQESRTLNQEYSVRWAKSLVPYLEARASLRYHDVGVDQSLGANVWRRQFQPAAEIIWNHPVFALGGTIRRQKSTSNNEATNLIRDNLGFSFSTRLVKYPVLTLRYDRNRTFNELDRSERDTRERRIQAGLDYHLRNNSFYYSLTRRSSENLSTLLEVTETRNLFRWVQTSRLLGDRLRVNSGYNFSWRSRSTEQTGIDPVWEPVPFSRALYAFDPSPDFGELDSLSSLADGNIDDPVQPGIDIGEGHRDHNIGVDFGFERPVGALYLYTDRPSGSILNWQVFTSSDNLTWRPVAVSSATFNVSFNRYEILFEKQDTRYVKAVNSGFNDEVTVLVTEVQALVESVETRTETKKEWSHMADFGATYFFSDRLESSFDVTYRREPRGDFSDSRDQLYYSFAAKHSLSRVIRQVAQYQAGYEDFKAREARNENASLSYTLLVTPLETLDFSFSAITRVNYIGDVKSQETNNLFLESNGRVLAGLNVAAEVGYSRNNRYDSQSKFDTWTYRIATDAYVTGSADVVLSYLYQTTAIASTEDTRIRRQYRADLNYRMTGAILLRAQVTANDDKDSRYVSQEYAASWNATRKLTLGGTVTLNDSDDGAGSARNNVRLNYLISPRTTLFASYASSEFSLAGRSKTTSLQVGLKSGF
ncbi:MAG TPA: hypothetical protein VMY05_02160 [Acidobacteriota bacterium]|nr:hypothetical protein [Acidobacteriota bacterium]